MLTFSINQAITKVYNILVIFQKWTVFHIKSSEISILKISWHFIMKGQHVDKWQVGDRVLLLGGGGGPQAGDQTRVA